MMKKVKRKIKRKIKDKTKEAIKEFFITTILNLTVGSVVVALLYLFIY